MKKCTSSSIRLYAIISVMVFGWWTLAFRVSAPQKSPHRSHQNTPAPARPEYSSYLSTLNRDLIQKGLAGDIKTMTALMSEWDVDARILEKHGIPNARRLTREKFLRAQIIGRQLLSSSNKETPPKSDKKNAVIDDTGTPFDISENYKNLLPQTYLSASFLLALTETDNIVALPEGFRNQSKLYPKSLTDRIPLDANRYNSEKIFLHKPDIAFVANYSHPSALQALTNQGIPLFTLKSIDTFQEIANAINRVGTVIQRPMEAELLTLFMEAAMHAIDNQLLALCREIADKHGPPRVMFLQHLSHFSLPTQRTITGKLLARLQKEKFNFVSPFIHTADQWMISVDQEQIVNLDPDCLIFATSNQNALRQQILANPAFQSLSAIRNNNIHFIDSAPQAPTQYVVLAYFDIAEALIKGTSP